MNKRELVKEFIIKNGKNQLLLKSPFTKDVAEGNYNNIKMKQKVKEKFKKLYFLQFVFLVIWESILNWRNLKEIEKEVTIELDNKYQQRYYNRNMLFTDQLNNIKGLSEKPSKKEVLKEFGFSDNDIRVINSINNWSI